MKNTLFPIFLKTDQLRFLIVGAGNVGLEKTTTILKQNPTANIKIVSKDFKDDFALLCNKPNVELIHSEFTPNHLKDTDLVVTATNNKQVNKQIKLLANENNLLVNAADQPDLCDFYLGSIVNKGQLKIAISTNGKSPVLARRIREFFEQEMPDNVSESIENLNAYRQKCAGNFSKKLEKLNKVTKNLSAKDNKETNYGNLPWKITGAIVIFLLGFTLSNYISIDAVLYEISVIPKEFYYVLLVGVIAQLVDGALGLGYGVTAASAMMAMGISLPAISGSIHTAEMFSSAVSGYSHYRFKNVNKKLLLHLSIPGVIGAVLGSLFVIYIGSEYEYIAYPFVALYLMIIAIRLINLAVKKNVQRKKIKKVGILGFTGGFLDAFGGGGWGPIVTSTLLSKGRSSKYVVGTVCLAEFFVTFAASMVFFTKLGLDYWYIVLGLALGGMIAGPFAAKLAGRLPKRVSYVCVGILVFIASLRIFIKFI